MQEREPVIVEADLDRSEHQNAVIALTTAYAIDDMGNGSPLPSEVTGRLIAGLQAHPTTLVFLAFLDDIAVGIATCFVGFSTFAARPLINVHDLFILPEHRGQGVGRALLRATEVEANERGCVKLTLEVWENNRRARRMYEHFGFQQAGDGETTGGALFYTKKVR